MRPLVIVCVACLLFGCGQKSAKPVSYREQIQPILNAKCTECHGAAMTRGKIDLTSYEYVIKARTVKGKKPLVVAGDPSKSWLFILSATDQPHYRMPPDTSTIIALPKEDLLLVSKWIQEGAKDN
jgi:hypothetical protein